MAPTHDEISPLEAREALDAVERGRRQVIAEIDVPGWYWWFLAAGWVAVGAAAAFGGPWVTGLAPLLFGALHAALAGHSVLLVVFGFLVVLCAATLGWPC